MSFEPPAGILDIGNATLRVGKLEVAETSGLNQGLQNIVKNDLLVTENTTYTTNQKWGIKLPTTWVAEFEVKGHSGKYIDFNFYNENSVSNAQGYNLTFKDTTMSLRYDGGSPLGGGEVTIPTIVGTFRKVHIFFERNVIAVSIDGTRYLYDKRPSVLSRVISTTGSAFVNLFIEENAANSAFKNLRIVNGRFISDETSNIAFVGGNLGVGVNSPQEALDIRGNMHFNRVSNVSSVSVDSNVVTEYTGPHDRPLRKYPEVAFPLQGSSESAASGATTFTYKSYTVTSNSVYSGTNYKISNAFDGTATSWSGNLGDYDSNGDVASGRTANYLQIQLPNAIKLENIKIISEANYEYANGPRNITLYGSNNGSDWVTLKTETDLPLNGGTTNPDPQTAFVHVNTTTKYLYYKLEISKIWISSGGATYARIGEWELYGHEEGSGSLDTTLKTVYNVPATTGTQLEVYYDGQDYGPSVPTSITDKTGNGNNTTTIGSGIGFDSTYKAFTFDGTANGKIEGTHGLGTGTGIQYSMSLWFKADVLSGNHRLATFGTQGTQYQSSTLLIYQNDIHLDHWLSEIKTTSDILVPNVWYHLVAIHTGPGTEDVSQNALYLNGVKLEDVTTGGSAANGTFNLQGTGLTIGADSAGTNPFDGSIANFRLYSKALNADQVKELYDYQKDYFLGSKSQLTIYKGHLGVGVTEPSGQLELAGDERIQEYPPRALTGFSTHIEGHGVFEVEGDTSYTLTNPDLDPWRAFNDDNTTNFGRWRQANSQFTAGSASSSGGPVDSRAYASGLPNASWLVLRLPYNVNLKGYSICPQNGQSPGNIQIWGSNNGGTSWSHLHSQTQPNGDNTTYQNYTITHEGHYSIIAYLILTLAPSTQTYPTATEVSIRDMKYYGTPGPTTLDKGSLSLTRSLDVPRISRYDVDTETPRPEKLVVDFDTTVNRYPIDISGKFSDGVFNDGAYYSAPDKAFTFDGSDDYIYLEQNDIASTSATHTWSLWFRSDGLSNGTYNAIFEGGVRSNNEAFGAYLYQDGSNLRVFYHRFGDNLPTTLAGYIINPKKWYHIAGSTDMSGSVSRFYVDGEQFARDTYSSFNITHPRVRIGSNVNGSEFFDGQVSNFKLYNVALEPSEVKKLYNLGRTGRSMVISDTAVGIGKTPEANLDVRGVTRFDGRVGIGTNVPHFALHIHGNDKYVQAVYSSQWINWLTNPNYNNVYNGDSPNYPHTTHPASNETGVYSRRSIGCSGYLWSAGNVLNMSDRRIKTNIIDVNDDICLRTLRQLKPKKYNYKDVRERGSEPVWGFIAQEVKETIPYSTTFKTEYVPNIQEKARLLDDGKTIVFTDFNTASLESNATTIRIMDKNEKEYDVTLSEILDPYTIRINEDITGHSFTYDQPDDNGNVLEGNYVYVHGQKVDDFVYLRKDAIWTVTTAALQEVDRQLQFERARNDALEARVTALEQAKYM